jgi:hypothetical protein
MQEQGNEGYVVMHKLQRDIETVCANIRSLSKGELEQRLLKVSRDSQYYEAPDKSLQTLNERIRAGVAMDVAILESRWFSHTNQSVKPIFDLLTQAELGNRHDIIPYERFVSGQSFLDSIKYLGKISETETLYVAAHGTETDICAPNDEGVDADLIIDALDLRANTSFTGLYFGSCKFCSKENAEYMIRKSLNLVWIAGYDRFADWSESTFLDGLFFLQYIRESRKCELATNRKKNIIENVCKSLKNDHAGLIYKLGFKLFMRNKSKNKTVFNMMHDIEHYVPSSVRTIIDAEMEAGA